ncbi:orotidine 5'-phosphate decarboxylase [Candidatus Woesearchaeota archaeon]|nr:orotidine 5'-phosphate decarboxylase [Candidatus Woesearchaeota archaeon]
MSDISFREKWLRSVEKNNSVVCAGLDPAEFAMGREEKGLAENVTKRDFALRYVEAVAPHCAALKPNLQYWKDQGDVTVLREVIKLARSLDLVVIDDSKLADIGSTNDAGVYHSAKNGFDAVTYSPFAGNMKEVAEQGKKRGVGIISMCLMSNPEYETIKNHLVDITDCRDDYIVDEMCFLMPDQTTQFYCIPNYMYLARQAQLTGIDGIVIGAPSKKNHIKEHELEITKRLVDKDMLVLLPGIGAQGGEAEKIWQFYGRNNVIVNVGRSMMLPKGSYSTPKDQADAAKHYQNMLNTMRNLPMGMF